MANEKRLIDVNKVAQDVRENNRENFTRQDWSSKQVCALLENAPTVDAVEVVHGHWHVDDYDSGEPDGYAAFVEVHCSECGYELGAESGQYGWYYGDPFPLNYCPNCGAKMDGDGNG